jgi:hypothetical protein
MPNKTDKKEMPTDMKENDTRREDLVIKEEG